MAGSRSELITMEGKEYCVPKRYQHSAASVVFSVSSVVRNMQGCNEQF